MTGNKLPGHFTAKSTDMFYSAGKDKAREERDGLHLLYAVPKTKHASNPHCDCPFMATELLGTLTFPLPTMLVIRKILQSNINAPLRPHSLEGGKFIACFLIGIPQGE